LSLALRLARRELRGGLSRFGVFLACLALGVSIIAAVGSFTAAVDAGLRADAAALLGGDVSLRLTSRPVSDEQLAYLESRGEVSRAVRMRAMASRAEGTRSLIELKGVDAAYPLYGDLQTDPPGLEIPDLGERDGRYGAFIAPELAQRLEVGVGDVLGVGEAELAIRGIITHEPDGGGAFFSLGPRVLVNEEGLAATELVLPGSLIRYVYRIKLPEGVAPKEFTRELDERFPDAGWRVRDLTDASPRLRFFMTRMELFLTLVGLTSLLVGGLGMAGSVGSYLEGKLKTIAVFKCVGATDRLVFWVYLLQIVFLAACGVGIGLVIGALTPFFVASWAGEVLPVEPRLTVYPAPLALAAAFGLLTAVAFSLRSLFSSMQVPGAQLFRAYLDPRSGPLTRRALMAIATAALAWVAFAVLSSSDMLLALYFSLGAGVAFLLFRLLSWAAARGAARLPRTRFAPLQLALRNLHRPGAATGRIMFSIGLGLTVLVAINLINGVMRHQIEAKLPERAPSYFFIDIQPGQVDGFEETIRSFPQVSELERRPMLRARVVEIDGVPVAEVDIPKEFSWTVRSDRGLTYAAEPPDDNEIVRGEWWDPDHGDNPGDTPLISLPEDMAQAWGLDIGETVTINILGREFTVELAATRIVEWESLQMNFAIILSPGVVESAPQTHIATVYLDPPDPEVEEAILQTVADKYQNITAIHVREVLEEVASLVGGIAAAVQATAGVTLVAGVLVLAGALRAASRRRVYEAVILKVVGATGREVLASLTLEYAMQGALAGLAAAILGTIGAWLTATRIMELEWVFLPGAVVWTILLGVALCLVLGLFGVRGALRQKPGPLLRNE
jgi:putative ABC transport system permease protein